MRVADENWSMAVVQSTTALELSAPPVSVAVVTQALPSLLGAPEIGDA